MFECNCISKILFAIVIVLMLHASIPAATDTLQTTTDQSEKGYRIDQPGTITFTVGVKITGRVEKPQVMIFLPKERTQYRDIQIKRSFKDEIMEPLPFIPIF